MSPATSLSLSKTQRKLWLSLATGVLVFLVLIWALVSQLRLRNAALDELGKVRTEHEKVQTEINALPRLRRSRDELFLRLRSLAEPHILYHRYRNYQLTAREQISPLAEAAGLRTEFGRETPPLPLPIATATASSKKKPSARTTTKGDGRSTQPEASASQIFALYPISLSITGSYDAIVRFVQALENSNPLLIISDLSITGQPRTPEEHIISLSILWPIWKDLDQKPKIQDLIMPMIPIAMPQKEAPAEPEEDSETSPPS